MKRYLRLYKTFFKNSAMLLMSHRFNFLMSAFANIIWTIGQVITLNYMDEKIEDFKGWTFPELILLLAFGQIAFYVSWTLYELNFNKFSDRIIKGEMDRYLTKPINIKFLISFEEIGIPQIIPLVFTAIPLTIYGLINVSNQNVTNILFSLVVTAIFLVIWYFICLTMAGLNFFFDDARSFAEIILNATGNIQRVPLNILPRVLQFAFTFIVPIGFGGFYQVIILRNDIQISTVIFVEIAILLLFIYLSRVVWRVGLRKYSGVG